MLPTSYVRTRFRFSFVFGSVSFREYKQCPYSSSSLALLRYLVRTDQLAATMGGGGSKIEPLRTCLDKVCGDRPHCVSYAGNPFYEINWVRRFNIDDANAYPWAIIRPQTVEDVSRIVQCAVDSNVTVQAKGGGHSYSNFAYDADVTIDLRLMQHFSMDNGTHNARIGGGSRLGKIDKALQRHGRAFAHGVCPGVGIGGHATIGGLGPMSRM